MAICYVAILNQAEYEYIHHAPIYLAEGGTETALEYLKTGESDSVTLAEHFDHQEVAVIALTYAMTKEITVSDDIFAQARTAFGDEQSIVEIVGVIAAYNMVSRFLVALGIEPE